MTETIDHETGEILPAAPRPAQLPTPYQSGETGQLADALAKAQGEMESPKRTKKSHYGQYAPLEEVIRVAQPALAKHGIARHQGIVYRSGEPYIRTLLRHSMSGEWIASDYPLLVDKQGPQGFAAGVTYARRYGLILMLGIAADDDDDGEAAQKAAETREQARPAPSNLKAAVESRLAGNAPQQSAERPAATNGTKSHAQARWEQIKDEIDQAATIEELNNSGIYRREPLAEIEPGVFISSAEEAQRLLHSDPAAAKAGAWQRLVDRDARRRLELVPQEEIFNG